MLAPKMIPMVGSAASISLASCAKDISSAVAPAVVSDTKGGNGGGGGGGGK